MSHTNAMLQSKGTRRFLAFVLSLLTIGALSALAMRLGTSADYLWPLVAFAGTYQAAGHGHDAWVRGKELAAPAPQAGAQ